MVIGTRPDAIKMLPVFRALKSRNIPVILCSTAQHNELLQQVLTIFGVTPDFNLDIMKHDQTLSYITAEALTKITAVLKTVTPQAILVQGDTATAYAASLAGFYEKIPVLHIEAGLRTSTIKEPFPEELYRRSIALIAEHHFAPTPQASAHLQGEKIPSTKIHCVGNTVIDALEWIKNYIRHNPICINDQIKELLETLHTKQQKLVVCTLHRREAHDGALLTLLKTIKQILTLYQDIVIAFPAHPNPKVQHALQESDIAQHSRFIITKPLDYPNFVTLLTHASWVMTDSGGVQEEAIALGKPTIVMRQETERFEGILEGISLLVGYDPVRIMHAVARCSTLSAFQPSQIYGVGNASEKIASCIEHEYVFKFQSKSYNSLSHSTEQGIT
jgi:UDP-N-acetylglucosamine 2-epimerase (non-hydrolysing)